MRKQVKIPLHGECRMMAALHENLRAAERHRFLYFAIHLLESDDVSIRVALCAIERAELAIDVANVGVVNVAINDVSDDLIAIRAEARGLRQFAAAVREGAKFLKGQLE